MAISKRTKELLAGGESADVEFKTKIGQDFNDILVAFANAMGGYCLLGVEDDTDEQGRHIGKIVGIEISDRTRGQIQSRADQTIDKIEIKIKTEFVESGRGIYIVYVKEGKHKPYCTGGGRYLVRRNGQNCAITPEQMVDFIKPRIRRLSNARKRLYSNELIKLKKVLRECIINIKNTRDWFHYYPFSDFYRELNELVENLTINDRMLLANCKRFLKIYSQSAKLLREEYFKITEQTLGQKECDKIEKINMDKLKEKLNKLYMLISHQIDALLS